MLKLILIIASVTIFILLLISIFIFRHKLSKTNPRDDDVENPSSEKKKPDTAAEELITFEGGEDLTIDEILEAPGEVIGKSHYGTLYKALLQSTQEMKLLRFLRPAAVERSDAGAGNEVVRFLGSIRHRNLVPMVGFYAGGRGEKLLIHPFYGGGNLAELVRGNFFDLKIFCLFLEKLEGKIFG